MERLLISMARSAEVAENTAPAAEPAIDELAFTTPALPLQSAPDPLVAEPYVARPGVERNEPEPQSAQETGPELAGNSPPGDPGMRATGDSHFESAPPPVVVRATAAMPHAPVEQQSTQSPDRPGGLLARILSRLRLR
jgi:hypothetical protein